MSEWASRVSCDFSHHSHIPVLVSSHCSCGITFLPAKELLTRCRVISRLVWSNMWSDGWIWGLKDAGYVLKDVGLLALLPETCYFLYILLLDTVSLGVKQPQGKELRSCVALLLNIPHITLTHLPQLWFSFCHYPGALLLISSFVVM